VFGNEYAFYRIIVTLVFSIATLFSNTVSVWALDHSGTIASNETWFAADNPLTIEDGVNVRFNNNMRLRVYGTLTAVGTPGTGIVFTQNGASNWNWLEFITAGSGTFDYCTIEYASVGIVTSSTGTISVSNSTIQNNDTGVSASDGVVELTNTTLSNNTSHGFDGDGVAPTFLDVNNVFENNPRGILLKNISGLSMTTAATIRNNTSAGIQLINCSALTLDNLNLTGNSGTYGAIYVNNTGEFTIGSGNTIGGVGVENSWPVTIGAGAYPSASSFIPTSGNINNDIQVVGTTRKFTDLDYIVTSNPTISAGGGLTIEDGVNVRFNNNMRLNVYGTLTAALGSSTAGVLFTRNGVNNWEGLWFLGASRGWFYHCTIEHADVGINISSMNTVTVVNSIIQNNNDGVVTSSGVTDLRNSRLSNNSRGVYATGGTVNFKQNRIINNTSYGVFLEGASPNFGADIDEWNDIYSNGGGNPGSDLVNGTSDINAQYVYWGTVVDSVIQGKIWDGNDDPSLGFVTYSPWSSMMHDTILTSVKDPPIRETIPETFGLFQNFPNPFNPTTTISFAFPNKNHVNLSIFNLQGKLVKILINDTLDKGYKQTTWDGTDSQGNPVSSGVYFYRLKAGGRTLTKKMVLLK
jgi:hypothetical protein